MANKPTPEQDLVNNHIIAVKKNSDARPDFRPAFTVMVDHEGNLFLVTQLTPYSIRMICEELCNSSPIKNEKAN